MLVLQDVLTKVLHHLSGTYLWIVIYLYVCVPLVVDYDKPNSKVLFLFLGSCFHKTCYIIYLYELFEYFERLFIKNKSCRSIVTFCVNFPMVLRYLKSTCLYLSESFHVECKYLKYATENLFKISKLS